MRAPVSQNELQSAPYKRSDKDRMLSGMHISDERLEEFRRIYKVAYGDTISVADARAMAHRLLALYRLLMQPLPGEKNAQPPPLREPRAQTAPEES